MIVDIIKLAGIILILDIVFLTLMSKQFNILVRNIQGTPLKFRSLSALICYIFIITLVYYFIVLKKASYTEAFLLGLCVYGIYETTNYALFNEWKPHIVVIDTIWGGILFSSSYFLFKLL